MAKFSPGLAKDLNIQIQENANRMNPEEVTLRPTRVNLLTTENGKNSWKWQDATWGKTKGMTLDFSPEMMDAQSMW